MHSKKSDPSDIEAFMKAWNNQVRVLKYHIVFQVYLRTSTMWIFFRLDALYCYLFRVSQERKLFSRGTACFISSLLKI